MKSQPLNLERLCQVSLNDKPLGVTGFSSGSNYVWEDTELLYDDDNGVLLDDGSELMVSIRVKKS